MAITSTAGDGVRATTAAKESKGSASVLGSPASSAANNIIVPDAITANNEGDLATTPSYVGRLICLRPWEFRLKGVYIANGGTGYAVSDVLTLGGSGVAGNNGAPTLTVEAVSGGVITEVSITQADGFDSRQSAETGSDSPPLNPVSVTGGTGSSATFDCIWEEHYEIRYITEDNSNTLTVHEDWDIPPVSGDNWALAYTLDDYATKTGLTLRTQSGVFEATRRIKVGPNATTNGQKGFLGINDGKALELDNVSGNNNQAFQVLLSGVLQVGYKSSGIGVNGGYLSTSGTASAGNGPEFSVDEFFGYFYIYDLQIRSPRELLEVAFEAAQNDTEKLITDLNFGVENCLFFKVFPPLLTGKIRNVTIQQDTSDPTEVCGFRGFFAGDFSVHQVDGLTIYGSTFVTGQGGGMSMLLSAPLATSPGYPAVIDKLKNIRFVEPNYLLGDTGGTQPRRWEFVNPQWPIDQALDDVTSSTTGLLLLGGIGETSIREMMSLIANVVDVSGNTLAGVSCYIYEGLFADELPDAGNDKPDYLNISWSANNQAQTEVVDWDEFNDYVGGLVRHVTNVYYRNIYRPLLTGTTAAAEKRGLFAWRGYLYGYLPSTSGFEIDLNGGIEIQPTLLVDSALTKTTATAALTLSPEPVVTKHGEDNLLTNVSPTDPRRMLAFNYDGGNGSGGGPDLGDSVTVSAKSPWARGFVVDHIGDGVTGTVLLEFWNGVDFLDGETLIAGFWVGTVDRSQSPEFYEEYTWNVDAQGNSAEDLYDYLAAKTAEFPADATFAEVIRWGGRDANANQLIFSDGTAFYTPRATKAYPPLIERLILFSDDFQRSPLENPVTGVGSPQPWSTYSGGNNWETNTVSSEIVLRAPSIVSVAKAIVNENYQTFSNDQWAKGEITDVSTMLVSGYTFYVHVRDDVQGTTLGGYYARLGLVSGDYQLDIGVYSSGIGVQLNYLLIPIVSPDDLVGATVELEALIVDYVLYGILWVNGEIYAQVQSEDTFQRIASGQPGVSNGGFSNTNYGFRNFSAGDFDENYGQGVWVSNRGTGTYDYFTSDSGQIYTIPVQLTITLVGMVEGSEIVVCLAGTTTEVASIENVGSPTDFSFNIDSGVAVDITIHAISYEYVRIEGVSFSGDTTIPIAQRFDRNYSNP